MDPKDRILEKAHELFNSYGLRSVSMDDIAAQVGMSKKTLYQYFTDKNDLVDAVFTAIMESNKQYCCQEQIKAENALHETFLAFDRTQEMFAEMNPSVLFDMEKYHPSTFNKFKDFKNGFLYGMIKANIERGISEGLYRADIDVDTLARLRIHTILLAFNAEVFPANRTRLVEIEQQLIEHFLYGLATSKGIKLILKYKSQRTKIKN